MDNIKDLLEQLCDLDDFVDCEFISSEKKRIRQDLNKLKKKQKNNKTSKKKKKRTQKFYKVQQSTLSRDNTKFKGEPLGLGVFCNRRGKHFIHFNFSKK